MRFLSLIATLALAVVACSPSEDTTTAEVAPTLDPTEVAEAQSEVAQEPAAVPEPAPTATQEPAPPDPVAELLAMPAPTPETGPPVVADDPAGLAAQLVAAERAIRDPNVAVADLAAAGHLQQIAYRTLGRHPEWLDQVLAVAPEDLHETIRRNTRAGAVLYAMHTPPDPDAPVEVRELPRWRIVEPAPAEELLGHYREAEAASGVHWSYLAAINLVETRMGRIRGDSHVGAQGPMQFMPPTWGEWGEGDVHDPRDAILAAGRYLRWGGMPGDVDGAIFRYNRDVRYVEAVRSYAEEMQADERAFFGYYHWQVYFSTGVENVWLAVGYDGGAS